MEKKSKSRDITGQEIGGFIPIRRVENSIPDGEEQWECRCRHCGKHKVLRKGNIKKTKSCGCLPSVKDASQKYVGKKYNLLTGLQCTDRKDPHNGWLWEWECDCGNIVEIAVKHVTNGKVKSCGCLAKKDITGQRFGRLVAICPTEKRDRKQVVWKFRCDCGKETEKPGYLVTSGDIQSCGCLAREQSRAKLKKGFAMDTNLFRISQEGDPLQSNNTSGYPGVWLDEERGRYMIRMEFQKVLYRAYSYHWGEAVWIRQMFVKYRHSFVSWWRSLSPEEQELENALYHDNSLGRGSKYLAWLETNASPEDLSARPSL